MHKKLIMACMAIAAFAAFVIAPAASASPILTDSEGTVANGSEITGTLKAGTNSVFTGSVTVTCSKAVLNGKVTANSGSSVKGEIPVGGASFTGTSGTGTECSSNLFGAPVVVTVNSALCLETVTGTDTVKTTGCGGKKVAFTLNLTGNGPCKYETEKVTGTYETGLPGLTVDNQPVSKVEGGFFCPSTGELDMTFNLYTTKTDPKHEKPLWIS
jgi:hypothetical protein